LKEAPKLHRENCKINWSAPLEKIHDQIRGLSPFPTAWTTLIENNQETMVKIYAAEILKADHSHETGAVVATKNEIKVAVKGGYIMVKEMQLPGKRKMNVKDILNGHKFDKNAHMR
jgi:methionyl-tRNA formyltransferase